MDKISIIVPVLNEEAHVVSAIEALAPFQARGCSILFVDGGSTDRTLDLLTSRGRSWITLPKGRASQMNAGARARPGDILLFLHVDTFLPADACDAIFDALRRQGKDWGRFDLSLNGTHPLFRFIAFMINFRSRLTGIATGDQALFMTRAAYEAVGGFPDIPLMEDVAICQKLRRLSRPACLRLRAVTSGRRWEKHGVVKTIALMWFLRAAFALGVPPATLACFYGYHPRPRA